MDAREYIQHQLDIMRRLSDAVLDGTTDEQLNWTPPGMANPIKAPLVHLILGEDRFIQAFIQGKPTLWEADGWGEKVGLTFGPGAKMDWEQTKSAALTLAPLLDYSTAVRAATDAYVASITPEELERTVPFIGGEKPIAVVLAQLVAHYTGHIGEIAALKGIQGVKGIPF